MTQIPSASDRLQAIDAKTLKQWLDRNEVILVDVREPGEYASERIPGALSHPLSQFDPRRIAPRDGRKLVLHCQSGNRSSKAARQCLEAGMESITHLQGGLNAWKADGYPLERDRNAPISLFRQVQIVAGTLVLVGTVLGATLSPRFLLLSGFVGAGLVFAGATNTCAMGMLLSKLPYNRRANQKWQ
jgi:rhodanese-related sulfurtransferase